MKLSFYLKHDLDSVEMPEDQRTPSGKINLANFSLAQNGIELQLEFIAPTQFERAKQEKSVCQIFDDVQLFYVCNRCGKVYWEGRHHAEVRKNFYDLIDKREEDKYYYGKPG